MGKYAVIKLL